MGDRIEPPEHVKRVQDWIESLRKKVEQRKQKMQGTVSKVYTDYQGKPNVKRDGSPYRAVGFKEHDGFLKCSDQEAFVLLVPGNHLTFEREGTWINNVRLNGGSPQPQHSPESPQSPTDDRWIIKEARYAATALTMSLIEHGNVPDGIQKDTGWACTVFNRFFENTVKQMSKDPFDLDNDSPY